MNSESGLGAVILGAEGMTIKKSQRHGRNAEAIQTPSSDLRLASNVERVIVDVERSGEWMPAEDLRDASLSAFAAGTDITVNLNGIDHLDASSLQILLALAAAQEGQERHLRFENSSPQLQQWFEYAGAGDHFSRAELTRDE